MAAVSAISRTPAGPVGLGVDGSGLLVDTMELVEPRKSQPVPNHLLETKIFSKVSQNSMVQARPAVIHYGGFQVDNKHVQSLSILNASTEVIRMHIIPPQTKFFYIKYNKQERLVPGMTLDCTIEFTPDEWRYYYDCIRINCPDDDNLIIPIHAYPTMDTNDFPTQFNFPPVPIGHRMTKVFPLRCDAPIDFEFQLTYVQPHPSFTVEPMEGIIPASGEAEVTVAFSPVEFYTAYMRIQLVISQFNSQPIICTFTGTSAPGLLKEVTLSKHSTTTEGSEVLDPRCLSPLDRARIKRKDRKKREPEGPPQEIEYGGIRFPPQLDTPYHVAQVLTQEPGKLRAKDLREAVITKKDKKDKDDKPAAATRQMKEAVFEHKVRQNVYEERQNQLRWQRKLGDNQITPNARAKIIASRNHAWNEYKYKKRGDPIPQDEYMRTCTSCTFRRTLRESTCLGAEDVKFDTYTNDMWAVRHHALNRFSQAAKKVIIRLRAEEKLKSLRKVAIDWRKKKYATEGLTVEQQEKIEEEEKKEVLPGQLELTAEKVKKYKFPTYAPPNVKDDMAPDALGVVPFRPTDVVVKRKVPYFNLKVPKQYVLMGYKPHNVHHASSGYVPPKLVRPLRSGAEDEVINLPAAVTDHVRVRSSLAQELVDEGDLAVMDVTEEIQKIDEPIKQPERPKPDVLAPPQALFKPIDYPPLHIFNPAPGLQVFQSPMPYGEVDPDFHLCPLPRYLRKDHSSNPHASTQRKYLDRDDVIRGIMAWKKFPSQGLTSLANTPTLSNVWIPRWVDPFGTEILPHGGPPLLDHLEEDDEDNIVDEEETADGATSRMEGVNLTPEMVNSQFSLIDSSAPTEDKLSSEFFPIGNKMPATNIPVSGHGPVPREKREEELEQFMTKKYNRLGSKIQGRITSLNNLITDPNLILK